jgi:hypothetical protein
MMQQQASPSFTPVQSGAAPIDAMPDVRRLLFRLVPGVFGSVLVTAALAAGGVALSGRQGWWGGWLAATVIALAGAVAAMLPIAPSLFGGMGGAVYGYLAGAVLRMLLIVGGCIAAVVFFRTFAFAMLVLIVPMFFVQLVVEAILLSGALWPRKNS